MMKRISAFSFALLASALLASSESSGANLLSNGSFEDEEVTYVDNTSGYMGLGYYGVDSETIPGWTVEHIDWTGPTNVWWHAAEGSFTIDMNGAAPGYIKQGFSTVAGQSYTVSFDLADNCYCGPQTKTLRVSAADSEQDYYATGSTPVKSGANWVPNTFEFTAEAGWTTLKFNSLVTTGEPYALPFCGAIIDNVRAEADPVCVKDFETTRVLHLV